MSDTKKAATLVEQVEFLRQRIQRLESATTVQADRIITLEERVHELELQVGLVAEPKATAEAEAAE